MYSGIPDCVYKSISLRKSQHVLTPKSWPETHMIQIILTFPPISANQADHKLHVYKENTQEHCNTTEDVDYVWRTRNVSHAHGKKINCPKKCDFQWCHKQSKRQSLCGIPSRMMHVAFLKHVTDVQFQTQMWFQMVGPGQYCSILWSHKIFHGVGELKKWVVWSVLLCKLKLLALCIAYKEEKYIFRKEALLSIQKSNSGIFHTQCIHPKNSKLLIMMKSTSIRMHRNIAF